MTIPPRHKPSSFFVAGGTLKPNAPSYVKRPADDDLPELIRAGEFAYVLTTRQMGKSSLINRTAYFLQKEGFHIALIDLTKIGRRLSDEEWYLGLLDELSRQLRLSVAPHDWWQKRAWLGRVQRFIRFLEDVVLTEIDGEIVIFVDEIDLTLTLDFSDDFFAAIRAVYNARAQEPAFERLTFVLSGVASPSDLIKDRRQTPFNIGQGVLLQDFSRTDATETLLAGLEKEYGTQAPAIFERIYYWTDGHPYLTQKLCQAVVKENTTDWIERQIDDLVAALFFSYEKRKKEDNLKFVQDRILTSSRQRQLLRLYRKVYQDEKIADDPQSLPQTELKLSGLVKTQNGHLQVRNRIYKQVFYWLLNYNKINFNFLIAFIIMLISCVFSLFFDIVFNIDLIAFIVKNVNFLQRFSCLILVIILIAFIFDNINDKLA